MHSIFIIIYLASIAYSRLSCNSSCRKLSKWAKGGSETVGSPAQAQRTRGLMLGSLRQPTLATGGPRSSGHPRAFCIAAFEPGARLSRWAQPQAVRCPASPRDLKPRSANRAPIAAAWTACRHRRRRRLPAAAATAAATAAIHKPAFKSTSLRRPGVLLWLCSPGERHGAAAVLPGAAGRRGHAIALCNPARQLGAFLLVSVERAGAAPPPARLPAVHLEPAGPACRRLLPRPHDLVRRVGQGLQLGMKPHVCCLHWLPFTPGNLLHRLCAAAAGGRCTAGPPGGRPRSW